jgi:hypothetical protein
MGWSSAFLVADYRPRAMPWRHALMTAGTVSGGLLVTALSVRRCSWGNFWAAACSYSLESFCTRPTKSMPAEVDEWRFMPAR